MLHVTCEYNITNEIASSFVIIGNYTLLCFAMICRYLIILTNITCVNCLVIYTTHNNYPIQTQYKHNSYNDILHARTLHSFPSR